MIERDIWAAARQMIDLYGIDAGWNAGLRAERLLEQVDETGYNVWRRILAAVKELQQEEPGGPTSKH
jgi:hypothetical protein